jgi:hypothetical protein
MEGVDLHIGVDFDNTIVRYDAVFHRLALEEELIPGSLLADKTTIRDHLRAAGREDRWTAMQAVVYGKRMLEAQAFPGVLRFFEGCAEKNVRVSIISHRTRRPIVGEPFDLHAAAFGFLEANGIVALASRENIFFEETRAAKVTRVREQACTHFIDDLPEFLAEPLLPAQLERILFDPAGTAHAEPGMKVTSSWDEIRRLFDV